MFGGNLNVVKIAFDAILEGVIIIDSDAQIVFANKAIERNLGYEVNKLIGKDFYFLVPKLFQKAHKEYFKSFFKDPANLSSYNVRTIIGLHKNGNIVPLEIKFTCFEHTNRIYAQALLTDISERKVKEKENKIEKIELEEAVKKHTSKLEKVVRQLRDTNQALKSEIQKKNKAKKEARKALIAERELSQLKTRFLSLASHEFRTPLSGILTSATLISKYTTKGQENITKHIGVIKMMVNHLSNILDDFMSLERIEEGDIHYKFSSFCFNELMEIIIKEANSLLKVGQSIHYSPCIECPKIYQDKRIIQIIITNILYNAIKYSPENSPIDISVTSKNKIKIKITDKGIGIPKKDKKNIFERFFRASNATHLQGTGIGLNIVKANIEGLGGTIHFKSKENKGSTFVIKIPKDVKL